MFIIGHRGAAGLELENTKSSILRAINLGVDAVEIDVRRSKDNALVVCHDDDLQRIAGSAKRIEELTWRQLRKVRLLDGSRLLSLAEALRLADKVPVIIEIKSRGCSLLLVKLLKSFPGTPLSAASFKLEELAVLRDLLPDITLVGLERTRPIEIIQFAKRLHLNGIGLNFWLINPLTYWLARRAGLEMYVYTVNSRVLVWFLQLLYPRAAICTDHPQWFIKQTRI